MKSKTEEQRKPELKEWSLEEQLKPFYIWSLYSAKVCVSCASQKLRLYKKEVRIEAFSFLPSSGQNVLYLNLYKTFVSASTYILLGNMFPFRFIPTFETSLFNFIHLRVRWERRMLENIFPNAVSMLLFCFGVSIAFIFFSACLWSRVREKVLIA